MAKRNRVKNTKKLGLAVALAVLLTGCGVTQPEANEDMPSEAELANESIAKLISEADETPSTPTMDPPELSDEILEEDPESTEPIAHYVIEGYEYALRTSDIKPLEEIFAKECEFCDSLRDTIEESTDNGYAFPNMNFTNPKWLDQYDTDDGYKVSVYETDAVDVVMEDSNGKTVYSHPDGKYTFYVVLTSTKNGWKLKDGQFAFNDPDAEDAE